MCFFGGIVNCATVACSGLYISLYVSIHVYISTYVCIIGGIVNCATVAQVFVYLHKSACVCTCAHMFIYVHLCTFLCTYLHLCTTSAALSTVLTRLLKNIGLFCKRAL